MINVEIIFLGLALALDAAIVSFALGICIRDKDLGHKIPRLGWVCVLFGFFQALTLWLGSLVGEYFTFTYFGPFFQYLVSAIFLVISLKLFTDTLKNEIKQVEWKTWAIIIMAFATSLDSFAAGVSLATMPFAYISAGWVGFITLCTCFVFSLGSHFFEKIPEKWMLRFGAFVFFILGSQIFIENFF